jgi:DNA-binding IclR family transcriptional regulator
MGEIPSIYGAKPRIFRYTDITLHATMTKSKGRLLSEVGSGTVLGVRRMARPRTREDQSEGLAGSTEGAFLVRALSKGLTVLGLFDAENREWTLDEIAEHAGLPRMTAYRMIRTMEAALYLVRDPVTNRYHLGPALLATTYLSDGYAELAEIAKPYLRELTDKTGESSTLAVEVDGVAVGVDLVDTTRPFRREVAVGRIIGDTANANGKVFAAFKAGGERAAILAQSHPQITANTITDPDQLAAELDGVARDGVAFDLEERNVGTCAVAAPVRDQLGKVIAALSIVVPAGRFGPAERPRYAEAVKTAADSLSAFLGYSRRD